MEAINEAIKSLQQQEPIHVATMVVVTGLVLFFLLPLLGQAARWTNVFIGSRSVPLAPDGLPIIGHVLPLFLHCPWGKMYEWLGDGAALVKFRIGWRTGILVGSPYGLKRIFQTRQRVYEKDTDFSYKPFLSILGTGLVTADGDMWQRQRLLMAPAMRIDMLDAILPIAQRATNRLCERLDAHAANGEPVDIEEEFRLLTLQVIGEAILSLPPDECDRVFPELYLPVMDESNRRVLQPWRYLYPYEVYKYNRNVRQLNQYIINIIRQRRVERASASSPKTHETDILDRILRSVDERGQKWSSAIETQLCYEIKTFLLAGHETSAAMLTWSMYELSASPEKLLKIREEALKHLPQEKDATPPREGVENMLYTLGALKESLRKYSVVPVVTRNMAADDELMGHKLSRGSWIICHLQKVHHSWKDPLVWQPDRFMPDGEYDQFDEDIRPYMFVPFIQGPRNCLGQYFALLEARVVLGTLCARYNFKPVDAEKQGVTHPLVIPIGPVHGMPMMISKA